LRYRMPFVVAETLPFLTKAAASRAADSIEPACARAAVVYCPHYFVEFGPPWVTHGHPRAATPGCTCIALKGYRVSERFQTYLRVAVGRTALPVSPLFVIGLPAPRPLTVTRRAARSP
jgi:hypothetical protein